MFLNFFLFNVEIVGYIRPPLVALCRPSIYGYEGEYSKTFSNIVNYLEKFSVVNRFNRIGFRKDKLLCLWNCIISAGGLKSLSKCELRTFVFIKFCYYTMCRFNCVSKIRTEHLLFETDYVKILIPNSKTDQSSEGQFVYLPMLSEFCPVKLLCNYMYMYNMESLESPFLFPPLHWEKDLKIWKPVNNKPVSYTVCLKAFKSLLHKFNMSSSKLSLHSFRVGATTDAFEAGMPAHIIDRRGRWKNPNTKYLYVKCSDVDLVQTVRKRT